MAKDATIDKAFVAFLEGHITEFDLWMLVKCAIREVHPPSSDEREDFQKLVTEYAENVLSRVEE